MIDVVMVEGYDARIQFANDKAKYLMCRYICLQPDPEAALQSWTKYSRILNDRNATVRNNFYLNVPIEKDQARKDLVALAFVMSNKWTEILNESNRRFKELVEKVASASEHFSFGNSSIASLHRQIRQQLGKVHSESTKLEMSQIRLHSLLNESESRPTDFLDMKRPLAKLPPAFVVKPESATAENSASSAPNPVASTDELPDMKTVQPPANFSFKTAASFSPVEEKPAEKPAEQANGDENEDFQKTLIEYVKKRRDEAEQLKKEHQQAKESRQRQAPQFYQDLQKASNERWEKREAARMKREQEQLSRQIDSMCAVIGNATPGTVSSSVTTPAENISIGRVQPHAIDENVRRVEKGHVSPPGHHAATTRATTEAKNPATPAKSEPVLQGPTQVVTRQVTDSSKPPPPVK